MPKGTRTTRRRRGGTRWMRSSTTARSRSKYRVALSPPKSDDEGSKTITAPTCMCMVSVSSARKAASTPSRRSISPPRPGPAVSPSSAAVAETTQAPSGVGELALGDLHELGLLDGLDDQLGDAITPPNLVGGRGVGVDEQDPQLVAVA